MTGNPSSVAITATADGGYLGAWNVSGNAFVRGRYVDADGTPGVSAQLNTTTLGNQVDASMALLGNGHNVVTFTDNSSGADTVRVRILGDGAPPLDFAVPAAPEPQRESDVAALSGGGFAVAFTRDYGGGDTDINLQRYNADGTLNGGRILVESTIPLATDHASVAGLASGGFVVAWEQSPAAGGDHSVWFKLYDAAGVAVGGSQLIDSAGSINQDIQVAALQDGGFVVAYADNGWEGGDGTEITARIYNADGTGRSGYLLVNTDNTGAQLNPTITVLSNGYFTVGWTRAGVFYYQAYDPSGAAAGGNYGAGGGANEVEIAALADGRVANVRESIITDGDGNSVRSSVHALTRSTVGTAEDDILTGDGLRDAMNGGGGSDILDGAGADDELIGSAGDDTLRGGAGADTLEGGAGIDTASYYSGATGVTVDLLAGGTGGDAAGDVLTGIENLTGSNLGGDILSGNAGANVLQGWGGDDALVGGGGKDTLTGGVGADDYRFIALSDSVVGANADVITDFSHAQGDDVDLTGIDANTGAAGNQAFSFIGANLYSGAAGQLRFSIVNGVTTIAGDVNGDMVSDFHITLTGSIALVAADFVL
ncbi:calcium-binding protein [Inquilinus sp. CA228]|uniref:calcium-binding protein n=1 Tax=Inquilinus sp. CA228 TaxID=3455609 RepID=UPI003F8D76CE